MASAYHTKPVRDTLQGMTTAQPKARQIILLDTRVVLNSTATELEQTRIEEERKARTRQIRDQAIELYLPMSGDQSYRFLGAVVSANGEYCAYPCPRTPQPKRRSIYGYDYSQFPNRLGHGLLTPENNEPCSVFAVMRASSFHALGLACFPALACGSLGRRLGASGEEQVDLAKLCIAAFQNLLDSGIQVVTYTVHGFLGPRLWQDNINFRSNAVDLSFSTFIVPCAYKTQITEKIAR